MAASWLVFVFALALGVLASPHPAGAQPAGKVYRVGYLAGGGAAATGPIVDAFRQGLRDLGYVEGKNLVIEFRWAAGSYERLPDLAAEAMAQPTRFDLVVNLKTAKTLGLKVPPSVLARADTTIE